MSLALRKIANSVTTAVNENTLCTIMYPDGYTISPSGQQLPKYVSLPDRELQVQSADSEMLEHFGYANQQGTYTTAYGDGIIPAIQRYLEKGNAKVVMKPYGYDQPTEWQVVRVLESYNDWVKVLLWNTGT